MSFLVMKLMRRTYMYTQTRNVRNMVAKNGPKIAAWFIGSSLLEKNRGVDVGNSQGNARPRDAARHRACRDAIARRGATVARELYWPAIEPTSECPVADSTRTVTVSPAATPSRVGN